MPWENLRFAAAVTRPLDTYRGRERLGLLLPFQAKLASMIGGLRHQDRRVLDVIERLSGERDYPLSYDELRTAAGVSSIEGLESSLGRLETDGYILRNDEMPFGFEVVLDSEGRPVQRPSSQYLPPGLDPPARRVNIRGEGVQELTPREQQVFDSIIETIEDQGYPPSHKQLCAALGITQTTIHKHLQRLAGKKWIERDPATPHGIRILYPPPQSDLTRSSVVSVRVIGEVAASPPRSAMERDQYKLRQRRILLPRQLIGSHDPGQVFVMEVRGESMNDAGVLAGDHVVVVEQRDADHGDMVVAEFTDLTSEEAITVKYLHRERGLSWLVPAAAGFDRIDATEAVIRGKVVALLRYSIRRG